MNPSKQSWNGKRYFRLRENNKVGESMKKILSSKEYSQGFLTQPPSSQ